MRLAYYDRVAAINTAAVEAVLANSASMSALDWKTFLDDGIYRPCFIGVTHIGILLRALQSCGEDRSITVHLSASLSAHPLRQRPASFRAAGIAAAGLFDP